jgi:hypothetical protein
MKQLIKHIFGLGGNALITLFPFKYQGVWMFNDKSKRLENEAFIAGIDDMLDLLTAHIPNAVQGFKLTISTEPFPNYMVVLERRNRQYGGRWYYCPHFKTVGWLCPALFKYFWKAPRRLYARADALPMFGTQGTVTA